MAASPPSAPPRFSLLPHLSHLSTLLPLLLREEGAYHEYQRTLTYQTTVTLGVSSIEARKGS